MTYDIMNPTYPTERTASQVRNRMLWLRDATDNASALACLVDAADCLWSYREGRPFPTGRTFTDDVSHLPMSWLDAASGWVDRALAHSHGVFKVPTWW